MTKTPEPVAHGKMHPKPGSPPGIELDGHGNVIPFEQRTKDDQERAAAAGGSVKNPEGEAETPAPMKGDKQGKGGRGVDYDPAGQQGGKKQK